MISNCNIKAHRHTQMRGFAYFTSFGIDNVAILLIPREIDKLTTSSMPKDVTVLKGPRTRTLGCTISLGNRLHLRCDGDFLRCRSRE